MMVYRLILLVLLLSIKSLNAQSNINITGVSFKQQGQKSVYISYKNGESSTVDMRYREKGGKWKKVYKISNPHKLKGLKSGTEYECQFSYAYQYWSSGGYKTYHFQTPISNKSNESIVDVKFDTKIAKGVKVSYTTKLLNVRVDIRYREKGRIWKKEYGISKPYYITGLNPNTEYELQFTYYHESWKAGGYKLYNFKTEDDNSYLIWIHGLNGDETSWDLYANLFGNYMDKYANEKKGMYNVRSLVTMYTSDYGVASAANHIYYSNLNNKSVEETKSRNVVIAHSMGGIVARHLEKNHPKKFSGIVTFGSPHNGALIANNTLNGNSARYFSKGAMKVGKAEFWEYEYNYVSSKIEEEMGWFFTMIISPDYIAKQIGDAIDGKLSSFLNSNISTVFKMKFSKDELEDLKKSSSIIDDVDAHNPKTPVIQIWGNEEYPQMLRMASSYDNKETDDYYVKMIDEYKQKVKVKRDNYAVEFNDMVGDSWWYKQIIWNYYDYREKRYKLKVTFEDSYNFLEYEMIPGWDGLIGALKWEYREKYYWKHGWDKGSCGYNCDDEWWHGSTCFKAKAAPILGESADGKGDDKGRTQDPYTCWRRFDYKVVIPYNYPIHQPSDGLISKSDAYYDKAINIEAKNVNHIEMRGHEETRDIIEYILDRKNNVSEIENASDVGKLTEATKDKIRYILGKDKN